jgi:hypothetical protein
MRYALQISLLEDGVSSNPNVACGEVCNKFTNTNTTKGESVCPSEAALRPRGVVASRAALVGGGGRDGTDQ